MKSHKHLAPQQVEELKQLWSTGKYTQADLATQFNVSQGTVSKVVSGRHHERLKPFKLTPEQVQRIRYRALSENISQGRLGKEHGITQSEVWAILKRRSYGWVPESEAETALRTRLEQLEENKRRIIAEANKNV